MVPAVPMRRAEVGDAGAIARLLADFNHEFGDPSPPVDALAVRVAALLRGGDTAIVLAGEPPCGLAVLRFRLAIWSPGRECYLAELYVTPEERGHGIGRDLMEQAMTLARAQGADHMDLGTGEHDLAARALYESLGFSNREGKPDGPLNYFYEREL